MLNKIKFVLNQKIMLLLGLIVCGQIISSALQIWLQFNTKAFSNGLELFSIGIVTYLAIIQYKSNGSLAKQLFFSVVTLAILMWLIVKIFLILLPSQTNQLMLLIDFGYFSFYLLLLAASQVNIDKPLSFNKMFSFTSAKTLTDFTFAVACFCYLVLLPSQVSPSHYQTHAPSYVFYIVMDLFLILRFSLLSMKSAIHDWQSRYILFSIVFILFLLCDVSELVSLLYQSTFTMSFFVQPLWLIGYLFIGLALSKNPPKINITKVKTVTFVQQIYLLMCVLPVIHLVGYSANILDSKTEQIRSIILLAWVLIFAVILFSQANYQQLKKKAQQRYISKLREQIKKIDQTPQKSIEQSIVSNVNFAIFTLDSHGIILYANQYVAKLTHQTLTQVVGSSFDNLLSQGHTIADLLEQYRYHALIDATNAFYRESSLKIDDHKAIPVYLSIEPFSNDKEMFVLTLTDISQYKLAETEALSVKESFIANISHEFRTPLTIINGVINEISDNPRQSYIKATLPVVTRNVNKRLFAF